MKTGKIIYGSVSNKTFGTVIGLIVCDVIVWIFAIFLINNADFGYRFDLGDMNDMITFFVIFLLIFLGVIGTIAGVAALFLFSKRNIEKTYVKLTANQIEIRNFLGKVTVFDYKKMKTPTINNSFMMTQLFFENDYAVKTSFVMESVEKATELLAEIEAYSNAAKRKGE